MNIEIKKSIKPVNYFDAINILESRLKDLYENNEEDLDSNVEIPPQRDIRETQPTISVNYRVVKNMNDNNSKKDRNYSDLDNQDDWNNSDNDW